jgi:Zn-dependent protease
MTTSSVLYAVLSLVLIIPAIILHEVSHGYVAYLLGDPTAKNAGRLTLNPIAHVDLWGTILLPLLMFLTVGFALGYAKPVPINPYLMRKTSYRNGMLLTGAAGPVTNLVLAVVSGLGYRVVAAFGAPDVVLYIFGFFALINLVLAFFNLIPIPPLDGSRVVQRFLSGRALEVYNSLERYGILIVLALVLVLPRLNPNLDFLSAYLNVTVYPILHLLTGASFL